MTIPIIIFWLVTIGCLGKIYQHAWEDGLKNDRWFDKFVIVPLIILILGGAPVIFFRGLCESFIPIPTEYTTTRIPSEKVQYIKLDDTFKVFLGKEQINIPNEISFNAFKDAHEKGTLNYFDHQWLDHPERKVLTLGNGRILEVYDDKGNLVLSGDKTFEQNLDDES
jgi:hypothetical protein